MWFGRVRCVCRGGGGEVRCVGGGGVKMAGDHLSFS